METRKGILTPDQEKLLDKLIVFKNKGAEAIDGLAISLIDNQGIERLKVQLEEKLPGASEQYLYPIVDSLFSQLESYMESKETEE